MKQAYKRALRCLVGFVAILAVSVCALSAGTKTGAKADRVRLSRESGFYDEAFYLEMEGDGLEVRYTLDSTVPTAESQLYTEPVLIDDASANPNVYSAITSVSLELNPNLLERYDKKPMYPYTVPSQPVDKATVVRAACFDALGNRGEVVTAVYFVGFREKTAYDGVNIIAITTEPENLFDYEKGIYVLGKSFDDSYEHEEILEGHTGFLFWPANYWNKGKQWEREAQICFFDRDRNVIASGNYGIRIQGRGSRGSLPKSLNLYARKAYGAESFSGSDLFGLEYPLNRLNLNSGANDMTSLLTDYLVNELAAGLKYDTRPYEPYAMFLDGEFWGVYWLTPRYKEDYFEGKYHLSGDDVIEVKFESTEIGNEDDYELYQSMKDEIASGDMSDPEQYARACELIDIESCIDYYAMEIYIANTDWPANNFALWRTREVSDQPCADGKWRWLEYDVNISMSPKSAKRNFVDRAALRDGLFCSLMDNPDFETALCAKLVELARTCFQPERVSEFIAAYEQDMGPVMVKDYERFYEGTMTEQDFIDACEAINTFFGKRYKYIMKKYGEEYG